MNPKRAVKVLLNPMHYTNCEVVLTQIVGYRSFNPLGLDVAGTYTC